MKFDIVVIGAGSAGAVLATRLSENPHCRVGLIEAGPDFGSLDQTPASVRRFDPIYIALGMEAGGSTTGIAAGSAYDWNLVAESTEEGRTMPVPRGKVTGGSSSVNGSVFTRHTTGDSQAWVAAGNDEWSYEKLLPYYRKLETDRNFADEFHGTDGPMPVMRIMRDEWATSDHRFEDACVDLGFSTCDDHNRPDSTGVGPIPRNSIDGERMSTARVYLSLARARENLTIIPDAFVRRILFAGNRAVGVEVEGHGDAPIEADQIVLAAGAIGTPHLLALSGIGPADQLSPLGIPVIADLPGVGHGLRDHPAIGLLWQRDPRDPSVSGATRGHPGVAAGANYLRFTARGSALPNDCRIFSPRTESVPGQPDRDGFDSMYVGIYAATSSGRLTIESADPHVQPRLRYGLLSDQEDKRRMAEIIALAAEIGNHKSLRDVLGQLVDPGPEVLADPRALERWMLHNVRTSHHVSSTARMGPAGDRHAVVDQYGRVYGVEGLRIADASVFPDCPTHNPNLPTIMLAERMADFIKADSGDPAPHAAEERA